MSNQYRSQVHHSVPRFVLQEFSENDKIWIYDKHTDKSFRTNIRNVMCERDFNAVSFKGVILNYEQRLARLEDVAAPIIRKIVAENSISGLEPGETAKFCTFVAAQMLRAKQHRRSFELMRTEMTRRFPGLADEAPLKDLEPDELDKLSSLQFLSEHLTEFAKHFLVKHAVVLKKACHGSLFISDNPVVFHNEKTFGPYGNIGLAVPGIQIFYPLTSGLAVAFMCPTVVAELETEISVAKKKVAQMSAETLLSPKGMTQLQSMHIAAAKAEIKRAEREFDRLTKERAIAVAPDNLLFLNSLQIMQSYRYVASRRGDFDLVAKAMREKPGWRKPNLLRVA